MCELRHDFRTYYHVKYEDVEPDEAIDLIRTLPQGSLYRGAKNPVNSWTEQQYVYADILDSLNTIAWRLYGCPKKAQPKAITRPADAVARRKAAAKAKEVKRRIAATSWEAVEDDPQEKENKEG